MRNEAEGRGGEIPGGVAPDAAPATAAEAGLSSNATPPRQGLVARWRPVYREPAVTIMAVFLVFVVARYMQWGARRAIFAALRIEFTLGLLLTAVCIGLLAMRPVSLRPARHVLIGIGLLFAAMLVQLPFAAAQDQAHDVFVDHVIKFAFLTFFMTVLIQSPRYLRWFLYAFLFSCFYVTQESVRGLISGSLVWQNQGVMRLHGAVPIYQHPNSLAGVAMGGIPFVVFLFPVWRRWWQRAALLALLGTSATCVLYTGSRTGYVAFLAFLLFWWARVKRKGRWLTAAAVLGAITIAAIPQQYKDRFTSIAGEEAEGQSKERRIEILRDALVIFLENPTGVGVASFPYVRMQKFGRNQDTHNLYLEVATNLGVQGLIVFFFLVYAMLAAYREARRVLARQRRELAPWRRADVTPKPWGRIVARHDEDLAFLQAAATASEGFIFVRLVLGLFGMDLYEVYWWFGAGMAISILNLTLATGNNTARLVTRAQEAASAGTAC